ncbi:MAG: HIT domain-containing protein [Alphaproteobacteria bacterium]|nr:HIT domain-containing protein [Alphaproteobacteria bacterium]
MYQLPEQLKKTTYVIAEFELSTLLLMNDKRFPWVMLVPRRKDVRDLIDLLPGEQAVLLDEINRVAVFVKRYFKAQNLNIAALGNVLPILHVHIIARFNTDAAWPNAVWGMGQAVPYSDDEAQKIIANMQKALSPR